MLWHRGITSDFWFFGVRASVVALPKMEKIWVTASLGKEKSCCFGHVKFEMPTRHPLWNAAS